MAYFFELDGFKETFAIMLELCRWTFLKSLILAESEGFLLGREFKKHYQKSLKLSLFLNLLTQHEIIAEKTIVYGCNMVSSKVSNELSYRCTVI